MQQEHEAFIEDVGRFFETEGLPRISGRIFGLLLLTPGSCALDEIAAKLSVSRASVSTDARRLEECGLLERASRKGDRRDFYRIAEQHYARLMERRIASTRRLIEMLEAGERLPGLAPDVQARIAECTEAYRAISDVAIARLNEWKATHLSA